tara:strand:- start:322 stop:672 length:351 start_codon:yes stop_codon:yes gene_type:complete
MNYVDALVSLCPTAKWVVRGGKDIEWLDTEQTQPTEEEIVQKIAELEYQEEINEYQRQRAAEYPPYADQFDQIFHEGIDTWKATILDVKRKYPKQVMQSEVLEERKRKALEDFNGE